MVKPIFTEEDDALLAELGVEVEVKKIASKTPREERIIAGFEEIERFVEEHERIPQHGENNDIFERLYAVRLDKIRASAECKAILEGLDPKGLLDGEPVLSDDLPDDIDDDALLAELGVGVDDSNDITKLTHVRPRKEINQAEEVAKQVPCTNFEDYKHLFVKVQSDIESGVRKTREFKNDAEIKKGEFFILSGHKIYVAEMGDEFINDYDRPDRRVRVIYDNGTEISMLYRSLQRALTKDSYGNKGRRISEPEAGPLFSDEKSDDDIESGTIYVLRSQSEHPDIKKNSKILHKIGVTGGNIEKRIANAKDDPTFLMADVEVVATYKLSNINRVKLENLIHKFFEPARLNIEIKDRFGKPIAPREWFLVPLFIIDEAVEKIKNGKIADYSYAHKDACLKMRDNND